MPAAAEIREPAPPRHPRLDRSDGVHLRAAPVARDERAEMGVAIHPLQDEELRLGGMAPVLQRLERRRPARAEIRARPSEERAVAHNPTAPRNALELRAGAPAAAIDHRMT